MVTFIYKYLLTNFMNIIQVKELLNQGKNLIFYKRNVFECYNLLKDDFLCVCFNEPVPLKFRLTTAIDLASDNKYNALYNKTIPELMEILIEELDSRTLIIMFNHFEKLTITAIDIYNYLNNRENIWFICSVQGHFKRDKKVELYNFYKDFVLMNKEELDGEKVSDEVNITYTVYLLLALLFFIVYLKTASSVFIASILIGASWFAFLIFRTVLFVWGKV